MAPSEYTMQQKKELVVKAKKISLTARHLYKLGQDEILRKYVLEHERQIILTEAHNGTTSGHYAGKAIVNFFLRAGIWWSTLHKDAKEYCRTCDICQRIGKPSRRDEMALVPQVTLHTFDKWAIDFVGSINPPGKKTSARYIITTTDYLTRWAKA